MRMTEKSQHIDSVLNDFILSDEVLVKFSALLSEEFEKGLGAETHKDATVKMFPTFVRDVPDGTEEGTFLALDLGGSKFRILCIELHGKLFNMRSKVYDIPQSIMIGHGDDLFDHIAECLGNFLEQNEMQGKMLPMGFTFSFPCVQNCLTSAILVRWTKGFACTGVVGNDIVQLLRAALERRGNVKVDIIAVVNDTTGTLMSCAHMNADCRIGLIIGTGTNACYLESLEKVGTWKGNRNDPDQVIINTEWGAFGDNGCLEFIRTAFDQEIDDNSINKGKQLFEKMVSGMYMGEIVRRIISKFSDEGLIFQGKLSLKFYTPYTFKSKYVSYIESASGNTEQIRMVLKKMDVAAASEEDCEILLRVCTCVSTRSAHLVAAGVATILNRMKRSYTVVGVDGSVYRYHPFIKGRMEEKIRTLTDPSYKFDLMLSEDGSGRGAALVGAVAAKDNKSDENE